MEKGSDVVCGDRLVMSATDRGGDTKPRIWSIYRNNRGTEIILSDFPLVGLGHFMGSQDSRFLSFSLVL